MSVSIDEFLNPKSMLTPGMAGAVTMMIANTLWVQFGCTPKWSGIAISFGFGLLVFFASVGAPLWHRMTLYFLNSMIIFSMSVGANVVGTGVSNVSSLAESHLETSLLSIVIPSAHAEGAVDQATINAWRNRDCSQLNSVKPEQRKSFLKYCRRANSDNQKSSSSQRKFFSGKWM